MYFRYDTCVGKITIIADDKALMAIYFGESSDGIEQETPLIKKAYQQLSEYFAGERQNFDLPLRFEGTDFQKKVWLNLQKIPYGKVCSYKQLAVMSGNEKACRAVGMANNKNKLAIVVPCHRVIGSNGKLVGYAGGLDIKTKLLELEASSLKAIDQ